MNTISTYCLHRTRFYPFHPLRPMNRGMQDSRSFEKFIAIAGKLKVTYWKSTSIFDAIGIICYQPWHRPSDVPKQCIFRYINAIRNSVQFLAIGFISYYWQYNKYCNCLDLQLQPWGYKKWTIRIQWYFSRYRHRSIYRDNMAINVASANNFRPIHLDHLSLQPSASFIRIYGSLYFVCMDITDWMSLDISFIIIVHPTSWGRAILWFPPRFLFEYRSSNVSGE